MSKYLLILSILACFPCAQLAHAAGSLPITGEAVILVVPDHAVISFGIECRDPEVPAAKRRNDEIAGRFTALTGKLGIAADQLRTDCLAIEPHYPDRNKSQLVPEYFSVSRTIEVTVRDLALIDTLLTDAVAAGITTVSDVEFRTSEMRKHRDEARRQAVRAAREKAELLAEALGQGLGRATSISEGSIGWYGYANTFRNRDYRQQYQNRTINEGGAGSGDTTVPPGRLAVRAIVSITYDLE